MILSLPEIPFLQYTTPAHPSLRLSIVIPVKNEAAGICSTLDALRLQCDPSGLRIDSSMFEVLLLANNCSDETFSICDSYLREYPEFPLRIAQVELESKIAHIGTARRMLMDAAYERLMSVTGNRGIIVSTDGDSQADALWIYHIMAEMDHQVDVVGGRILPLKTQGSSRLHHLRDVSYRLYASRLAAELDPCPINPWPRHFQCYGPSLAVTCEIYERAGRLPAIPYLEDEEFRKHLVRIDARIRHSPHVKIFTSSRLNGRVEFGFSVQLQKWEHMSSKNEQEQVESLNTLIFKCTIKNFLRKLWGRRGTYRAVSEHLKALATSHDMDLATLTTAFNSNVYFESVWEQIEEHLRSSCHSEIVKQPASIVIQSLRQYFSSTGRQETYILPDAAAPLCTESIAV